MSGLRSGRPLLAIALLTAAGAAHADGSLVVASRGLASVLVRGEGAPALPRGERLQVLRDGQTIGEIEVTAASGPGASCRIVSQTRPIGAGDRVVRAAGARAAATGVPTAGTPADAAATSTTAHAAAGAAQPAAAGPAPTASTATAKPPAVPPVESRPSPPAYATMAPPASGGATIAATAAPKPVAVAVAPPAPKPGAPAASPAAAPSPAPPEHVPFVAAVPVSAPVPSTAAAVPKPVPAGADGAPAKPAATDAATTATARFAVKYRSASNVYLDGGRAQGLGPTDRLRIFSGATVVAELEVVYAAEQSASCRVVSEARPVQVGDVAVRLTPAAGLKALAAATTATPATEPAAAATAATPGLARPAGVRSSGPWARVRGSASFGYYRTWDQTESNYDLQERTGRVDLGVYDISGQPISFTLRGRSRQDIRARTLSDRTPKSERTDRLYEVALRYEPASDGLGLEAGRIGIYRFVGIGYLDGVLARFRPVPVLQVGGFAGRNADVEALGYGGTGSKMGGFLRLAPGGRWATGAYDATLAFVREDADGDVSREYLSLESRFGGGSRWSLFERAELDLNTGWRAGDEREELPVLERVALRQPARDALGLGLRLVRRPAQLPLLPQSHRARRRSSTTSCTRACGRGST